MVFFNHTSFHTHCIMLCGLSLKEQTNRTKSNENNKQKYKKKNGCKEDDGSTVFQLEENNKKLSR